MNRKIFEVIDELKTNEECYLLQVVDGNAAGSALAFVNGFVIAKDAGFADSFFNEFKSDFSKRKPGLYECPDGRMLVSIIGVKPKLIICGGGHVAGAIIPVARLAGFEVWVIDDRKEYAQHALDMGADQVICRDFETGLRSVPDSMDNYYVCVTRGHKFDKECLINLIPRPHAYIGVMGSKKRAGMLKGELVEMGYGAQYVDEIHTPVGLDIGAQTPEEIAVSIVAELISVRSTKRRSAVFDKVILQQVLKGEPCRKLLCTIVSKQGSAPRSVGTRMLVCGNGAIAGTLGGGYAESVIIKKCAEKIAREAQMKTEIISISLSNDIAEDEGMVCGGQVEVLIQEV